VIDNENAALVLMLKNPDTGFFEKELGQYKIGEDECFIEGLYAEQTEEGLTICLRMGVGDLFDEIDDRLYNSIYDKYDADLLPDFIFEIIDIDETYNPVWEARFLFSDNPKETEDMIKQALAGHKTAVSLLRYLFG